MEFLNGISKKNQINTDFVDTAKKIQEAEQKLTLIFFFNYILFHVRLLTKALFEFLYVVLSL